MRSEDKKRGLETKPSEHLQSALTASEDKHCSGVRHTGSPSHFLGRTPVMCRTLSTVQSYSHLRDSHLAFVLALALAVGFCAIGFCASFVASAEASAVLHDVQDVLTNYTSQVDGKLYFTSPRGETWELITDIDDSEITNKGDDSFHPFSSDLVKDALAQISYPLDAIPFDVFILPYPRRGVVESSTLSGEVFLSPGVLDCSAELVHFTVCHEVGHIVHRYFMADEAGSLWQQYRELRRITDTSVYNADAIHKNRPHEIFAEDFRFLFGSALGNYSGTIENSDLPLPTEIAGLKDFMASLAGATIGGDAEVTPLALSGFPNPFNPVLTVSFSVGLAPTELPRSLAGVASRALKGSAASSSATVGNLPRRAVLRVFDVNGRPVNTILDKELSPGSYSALWTGTDERGNLVSSGVYFLRLEAGGQAVTKKVILSR